MSSPKIYHHAIRVMAEDIDRLGHVNNVVYVRYAQDAAVAHWKAVTPQTLRDAHTWVTRRHEIDYLRPAFLDDDLIARTWIDSISVVSMERRIDLVRGADDALLTRVKTVWVAIDPQTHRPKRIDERLKAVFLDAATP